MLDREELAKYKESIGFRNIQQAETDYLQHIILGLLYSLPKSNRLLFKGGTALQKLYGLDRFSVDLDFTTELDYEGIRGMLEEVNARMKRYGVESRLELPELHTNSVAATFKMHGPVYASTLDLRSEATVRLDFSLREKTLLKGVSRSITPIYPDLAPYSTLSMDPREILAEKFRAIMTRSKTRDAFDFDFMIRKRVDLFYYLVEKKMSLYRQGDLRISEFLERIKGIGAEEWKKEINDIAYAPANRLAMLEYRNFDAVLNRIEAYLKDILNLKVSFSSEERAITKGKGKTIYGRMYTFADMKNEAGIEELGHSIYTNSSYEYHILAPEIEKDCFGLEVEIDGVGDALPVSAYYNNSVQNRRIEKGHNISVGLFIGDGCSIEDELDIGLLLKRL
ncbi:MAG: nucleotidyl transferase AbiEii/AbiGii toxin family protein [Candidatus Micrarchaeia archaeon]